METARLSGGQGCYSILLNRGTGRIMKTEVFRRWPIGYMPFVCMMLALTMVLVVSSNQLYMESLPDEAADYGFGSADLSKLSDVDRQYLGLADDAESLLRNIAADLIIVEFVSVYCPGCQMQAPVFNQLYSAMAKDPTLQAKVKMVAIGVGNNQREVSQFKKNQEVVFPMLPDPKFTVYERLANSMRAPYTVLLKKSRNGDLILVSSHMGLIRSYESFLEEIKAVMQYSEDVLKLRQGERLAGDIVETTELKLSGEELIAKLRETMIKASSDKNLSVTIKAVPLPEGPKVYEGYVNSDGRHVKYFAVVVSRESICDICHAIQFIYVLDETGKLVSFEPIHLTKYENGNKIWNEKDLEKMRQNVIGRSILEPIDFDPEVDAVTSATITSAVIFHALAQGKRIFRSVIPSDKVDSAQ